MPTESEIQALLNGPGALCCVPMRAVLQKTACEAYQLRPREVTPCTGCVACTTRPPTPLNFYQAVKASNWTKQKNKEIKAELKKQGKTLTEHRQIANAKSAHHRREFADERWQDLAEAHGFTSEREMLLAWRLESNAEVARRLGVKYRETVRDRFLRHPDIRRIE